LAEGRDVRRKETVSEMRIAGEGDNDVFNDVNSDNGDNKSDN